MKLKKWLASGLAAILLATGAAVAVSSPASAHNARVTGIAVCEADGTRTVTWTGTTSNVPAGETATATVKSYTPPTSNIATTTASVAPNGGFTFTQTGIPGTANNANINVDVLWTNGYKVSDQTGHVQFGYDCEQPDVLDASAAVTIVPATCTSPGSVLLGAINFASLVGTLDLTPGTHVAVFQAAAKHRFADGTSTASVSYTIPDRDRALCPDTTPCIAPTSVHSTDLAPNGWSGEGEWVEGGYKLSVDGAWESSYIERAVNLPLKDALAGLDINAAPLQYVGLHFKTADGRWITFEEEPSYSGKLWSESAFSGVPSGLGYIAFGTADEFVAENADLEVSIVRALYTHPEASSTVLTSVSYGCGVYTFDKVDLIDTPEPFDTFERTEYVGQGWVCDATTETLARTEVTVRTFFKVVVVGDHYEVAVDRVERSEPVVQTIIRQLDESEIFDCPTVVTTGEVSKVDECGIANDKVVLPETEGVTYTVVWSEDGQSQATVTAAADEGYELEEGAQTEWVLDFTNEACPKVVDVPGDPTLADTGVKDIFLLTGALAVLMLLAGAVTFITTKRRYGNAE